MKNITLSMIKKSGLIMSLSLLGLSSLNISHAYAHGNADVGINLIGNLAPGVYGRININSNQAPPPVIYSQPIIVERPVRYYSREPVYMHVPNGHYRHWAKNCYKYNACGQNVYFVNPSYLERRREAIRDRQDDRRDIIREVNYYPNSSANIEYNERIRYSNNHRHHHRHHREEHRDGRWGDREDY